MTRYSLTAILISSSTALVAIFAILMNNGATNKRLDHTNARLARVENKLDHIKSLLVSYALDVARIKEKLDI